MSKWTKEIIEDNYKRKVKPYLIISGECLLYSKTDLRHPYGCIAITSTTTSTLNLQAHRLSYFYHNNILSTEGLFVLHSCDTPACCNPAHLRLGTNQDNIADKLQRGRHQDAKGTANPNAKLTEKQALQIYLAKGTLTSIGQKFGVGFTLVHKIKRKQNWIQLTDAYDELMVN